MDLFVIGVAQVLRTLFSRRLSPFLAISVALATGGAVIQYSDMPAHDQIGGAILAVGGATLAVVVVEAMRLVEDQFGLLGDLHRLGIARIQSRSDADENMGQWHERVREAREVDLLGLVLRDKWAHSEDFMHALEEAVRSNRCHVRILTLCPSTKNSVFQRRAREEEGAGKGATKRMLGSLAASWDEFQKLRDRVTRLDASLSDCMEFRHVEDVTIYCQFIRADKAMRISHYVAHQTGKRGSMSIEVCGDKSSAFKLYKDQFDYIFANHSHEALHEDENTEEVGGHGE